MMPRATLLATLLATAAILALLGGCSSAPVTRYYVLSATAPAPAAAPDPSAPPPSVLVRQVVLPQYLDRAQIVTRDGAHSLRIAETALWAGDLGQDMTRVLVEDLGRLLHSDRVVAAPHGLRPAPGLRLEVEVLRFERGADGRVVLGARWRLMRVSDGALLAGAVETIAGAPLAAAASYEAVVASMSETCGTLAQAIARGILAHRAGAA